jgi:hypothetical protein
MTRVRIRGGYLNIGRRQRPGGGGPVDPDYGVDEGDLGGGGEGPEVEPPDIDPPPGIWPGPSPGHPIVPMPPAGEGPGHLPEIPPGAIWPRPPHPVQGKFIVLAHIPSHGWRYIVIDPDAWPVDPDYGYPEGGEHPSHPIAPGQPIPPREPKR